MTPIATYAAGTRTSLEVSVDVEQLVEAIVARVVEALDRRSSNESPWMNIDGAAAYLGCSPERIRKLVQRRGLPFHQEGRGARIFLNRHELDQWLLQH